MSAQSFHSSPQSSSPVKEKALPLTAKPKDFGCLSPGSGGPQLREEFLRQTPVASQTSSQLPPGSIEQAGASPALVEKPPAAPSVGEQRGAVTPTRQSAPLSQSTSEQAPVYQHMKVGLSQEDVRLMGQVLDKYNITISVIPPGKPEEEAQKLVITKDNFQSFFSDSGVFHPLLMQGHLLGIRFENRTDVPMTSLSGPSRDEQAVIRNRDGYRDSAGNAIETKITEVLQRDPSTGMIGSIPTKYQADMFPYHPYVSAPDQRAASPMPVDVELSVLGSAFTGQTIHGLIYQQPLVPVGPPSGDGHVSLYNINVPANELQQFQPHFPAVAQHIGEAERLFGFSAGNIVGRLNVVYSNSEPNASFRLSDPSAITLNSTVLSTSNFQLQHIIGHETFHAINGWSNNNLSGSGKFKQRYQRLRSEGGDDDFFNQIDESRFAPSLGLIGGHVRDNPSETFASFLNTLTIPEKEWKEALSSRSQGFRQNYLETMNALETNLRENRIPSSAPIFAILAERKQQLEQMMQ